MHVLATIRQLDQPPSDSEVERLRRFIQTEVMDTALKVPDMQAIMFLMSEDHREMRSMSFWRSREELLGAEVSPEHTHNSARIMELLKVQRPQEHRHYQLLHAHNVGMGPHQPPPDWVSGRTQP